MPEFPVSTLGIERYWMMRSIATVIDDMLRGKRLEALDQLVQLNKALVMSVRDGHWRAAKFMLLIPLEAGSNAVSASEEEVVRRLQSGELKLQDLERKVAGARSSGQH